MRMLTASGSFWNEGTVAVRFSHGLSYEHLCDELCLAIGVCLSCYKEAESGTL